MNDLDIKTTKYGGGLRVSYVEQCDGMGNCYYDNYFYAGCHECIAEGGSGTEACGNLSGSNSQLAICYGLAACQIEGTMCVCADPGVEDTLNCPVPFVPDGESSGYALGVPPATQHSLDFQQRGALQPAQDLPETLVQSSHFNVQYTQVVQYQSSEPQGEVSWGMTVTEFTSPMDTMENEEGENVSLAGGGFWSPGRIFHAYDWKQSGSKSGGSDGYHAHAPHGDDYWVSFDRSIFVPKKGNELYNHLQFKENENYFVAANSPGYLFWAHFNAGRNDCGLFCSSGCETSTAQHPSSGASGPRPPFIGDSCPGEEEGMYCGTLQFEDRGVGSWDWESGGMDCDEPGEILIFCPSDENGLIEDPSNSNDNWNPYAKWQSDDEWRGTVESRFNYGLNEDDETWRTTDFDWGDTCYQVFGGHKDISTSEKPQFSSSAILRGHFYE